MPESAAYSLLYPVPRHRLSFEVFQCYGQAVLGPVQQGPELALLRDPPAVRCVRLSNDLHPNNIHKANQVEHFTPQMFQCAEG